jgi:hypothetical protein
MTQTAIFWPMLAQVGLVYMVYALLSLTRRRAVLDGIASATQFRENRDEPPPSLFVRNNLVNQFELPTLFFAACLSLHSVGAVDTASVVLAWGFVASRYLHAAIHVTTNRLRWRAPAFTAGFVLLGAMWAQLALHILS